MFVQTNGLEKEERITKSRFNWECSVIDPEPTKVFALSCEVLCRKCQSGDFNQTDHNMIRNISK